MSIKKAILCAAAAAALMLPVSDADAARLDDIAERGTIRVGTTGDYRPMSYYDAEKGAYEGFDIELAQRIADTLHVKVEFVKTSWPTLSADTQEDLFDIAVSGISRTFDRERTMELSEAYCFAGKTILCRADQAARFKSLEDINRPDVRVMVNPGGTNEKFARAKLDKAQIIVHQQNAEIPGLVSEGKADIMITETPEVGPYIRKHANLAAPLVEKPFTKSSFGVLMKKGDQEFLNYINFVIQEFKANGTMDELKQKYMG